LRYEYLKTISQGIDKNAALHDLMIDYGDDVWNYIFFLTRQSNLADDLSQDVFLKVFEKLHTYRGQSTVKTWILSITYNAVRDHWRSAWLRKVTLQERLFRKESAPSAEAEFLADDSTKALWDAVLTLPLKLREVLLLHAHHQLALAEIADVLNISQGTVKSRLFRARARVAEQLKRLEQADFDAEGADLR